MINSWCDCCCSVAKLCPSLSPHGLQHTRLPWPSPSPGVCSNSCLLSRWCHPTISSSVIPFSSCLQSFPASGSFPASLLFTSGGQSIGASASVLPVNIQGWFPLGLTDLISLQSRWLSRVFSSTIIWSHQFLGTQSFHLSNYSPQGHRELDMTEQLTLHFVSLWLEVPSQPVFFS